MSYEQFSYTNDVWNCIRSVSGKYSYDVENKAPGTEINPAETNVKRTRTDACVGGVRMCKHDLHHKTTTGMTWTRRTWWSCQRFRASDNGWCKRKYTESGLLGDTTWLRAHVFDCVSKGRRKKKKKNRFRPTAYYCRDVLAGTGAGRRRKTYRHGNKQYVDECQPYVILSRGYERILWFRM